MQRDEFRAWLCGAKGLQSSTASNRVSNCERVRSFEGSLDRHYENDRLATLLEKLDFSKDDQRKNVPARHAIPIDGDIYNGTATLRSAVKLYLEFKNSDERSVSSTSQRPMPRKSVKTSGEWPEWEMPPSETLHSLVQLVTPYVRFLHPDIVRGVVEDNHRNMIQWRKKLIERRVDPSFYLWDKSSCTFPGIRRYSGSREIAFHRKRLNQEDFEVIEALKLDDNSFPKHIWSFTFRGKAFQNFGPPSYSLAHLADHKEYKNRCSDEFDVNGQAPEKMHGLYSCASNTVYMPNNLLKLSDFNTDVRLLLLHKAQNLYGVFCNLLPPSFSLKSIQDEKWNVDRFEWSDPVGDGANITDFLRFRKDVIDSL